MVKKGYLVILSLIFQKVQKVDLEHQTFFNAIFYKSYNGIKVFHEVPIEGHKSLKHLSHLRV